MRSFDGVIRPSKEIGVMEEAYLVTPYFENHTSNMIVLKSSGEIFFVLGSQGTERGIRMLI